MPTPPALAMISVIVLVVRSVSRAATSMSGIAPRKPVEPWWISTRACGSAARFPFVPAIRITAAIEAAMPTQ